MVNRTFHFSKEERDRVEAAVKAAESRTSGEIVPWVVPACKGYRWVHPMMALFGLALATAALVLAHRGRTWDVHLAQTVLWQAVGACAGFALSLIPAVKRALIPAAWLAEEAQLRSLSSFVSARLTETRQRNGVLIFIALFERRVHILADKGLNDRVAGDYWDERVREIVGGVHAGRPIESLCESISRIGTMLAREFPSADGGENELSDELRE
jgi:putative membrane protein